MCFESDGLNTRQMRQEAASKPALADHVGTIYANMTREEVKDLVYGLTPEQKLDPAKLHFIPSSVRTFQTKPAKSCTRSLQCHELGKYRGYRDIPILYTVQSWMGCSIYPVCLTHTEHHKGIATLTRFSTPITSEYCDCTRCQVVL